MARQFVLPQVGLLHVEGIGGSAGRAPLHAAVVELAGLRRLARVVAHGEEAIVGRDLLNQIVTVLDGPRLRLTFPRR